MSAPTWPPMPPDGQEPLAAPPDGTSPAAAWGPSAYGPDQAGYADQPGVAWVPPGYGAYSSGYAQQPGYAGVPYGAPFAYVPGMPLVPGQTVQTIYGTFMVGDKSKLAAGLLGIFLGVFGVGAFYRGFVGRGVAQLIVSVATFGLGGVWGLIEGIVVLASQPGSSNSLDADNRLLLPT
ncbi:MAG: TM2 domain-containing protein [Actinomycetia bacterium]|nr:TM2 domain-containing protein [Actinomycetes bacterium]